MVEKYCIPLSFLNSIKSKNCEKKIKDGRKQSKSLRLVINRHSSPIPIHDVPLYTTIPPPFFLFVFCFGSVEFCPLVVLFYLLI